MTSRTIITAGLSALALAGVLAGQGLASSDNKEAKAAAKAASADARRAGRALDGGRAEDAVRLAEHAVVLMPRSADYRMLLGQGYLKAGRFASAATAFADVLLLDPANGRAALNLALMQVAAGDWNAARKTLATHADRIAAPDRGLALALAGDPAGVQLLMAAARERGATATVRQNLALALALAGQWQAARVVAATDLSPAEVDRRLQQWAVFAQPQAASDQVAGLMGVTPVVDPGLPKALALDAQPAPIAGAVEVAAAPILPSLPDTQPKPMTRQVEPTAALSNEAPAKQVIWAPRREVVQPVPLLARAQARMSPRVEPLIRAKAQAFRSATGGWHVQLGAYGDTAVARQAWQRFVRLAAFQGRMPAGSIVRTGSASLFRLSVGGLGRAEADALCRRHRAEGGACFVRADAGDRVVRWDATHAPVQLARRS